MPARRVASFFVLVLLLIAAVLFAYGRGAVITYVVTALFTIAGTGEFFGLVEKKGARPDRFLGVAGGFIFVSVVFAGCYCSSFPERGFVLPGYVADLALFLVAVGIFSRQMFKLDDGSPILSSSTTLAGVIYVAWLFSFVIAVLYYPGLDGRWYVFFLFLATKGSDTCAYLAGRAFGRNKLIPRISPSKTREGFMGGLAGAVIGGLIGLFWFRNFCPMPPLSHVLILSIVLGLAGIPGDLFESILKRDAGVKDVAGYLPGLGGVLDVIDSVLWTAPILYFYLVLFTP